MDKKIIKWREIVSLCGKVVSKLKDNHPDILDHGNNPQAVQRAAAQFP